MEFKGKMIEKDGKKMMVVEAVTEEINYPDGRKDVIIHAPSLDMMQKARNLFKKENE